MNVDEGGTNYSVLGIFFNVPETTKTDDDGESAFIKNFFAGYDDRDTDDDSEKKKKIDMALLIPELKTEGGFWMYDGSFTTPPCTEGVKWTVLKQPSSISKA